MTQGENVTDKQQPEESITETSVSDEILIENVTDKQQPEESITELKRRKGILMDNIHKEQHNIKQFNIAVSKGINSVISDDFLSQLNVETKSQIQDALRKQGVTPENEALKKLANKLDGLFKDINMFYEDSCNLKSYEKQFKKILI